MEKRGRYRIATKKGIDSVGYMRYDTEEELGILNEIYRIVRLPVNFFYPSMKLIKKERIDSKVKKKYDYPKTPYQRLIESKYILKDFKQRLTEQFDKLNPAELQRKLLSLQTKLRRVNSQQYEKPKSQCS